MSAAPIQLIVGSRMQTNHAWPNDTIAPSKMLHALVATLLLITGATAWATIEETPSTIGNAMPLENATDLKEQPLALLAKFPEGGAAMAHFVAQAIIDRPALIDAFLSIAGDTSPQQAAAMGAGIVRATRILETKQPMLVRAIAGKVMRSNNSWLKISFSALGPHYSKDATFVALAPLPPAPLMANKMGTSLPIYRSRIGPTRESDFMLINNGSINKNGDGTNQDSHLLNQSGMIVAIIASDAALNGATSTSPTN